MVHLLLAASLLVAILFFFLGIDVLFFVGVFILRRLYVELQCVRVDEADITDRQVLPVPGIERYACELSCDAVVVEKLAFRATYRVHDIVERSVGVLPLVPEPLASLDPVRRDRRAVYHLLDLIGRKACREIVVRRSRTTDDVRATASSESYLAYLNVSLLSR